MTDYAPSISIVIPTLNSEKVLCDCLESIKQQEYGGTVEVIIADGGSVDCTIEIARANGCVIVYNPNKTGEAGKALGVRNASCEIIALIDSDNILPCLNWLELMIAPFSDPEIAGTEPIEYEYRRSDSPLTRYCAMTGMNDPLCYFLKNYDRMNALSGQWTGLDIMSFDRDNYLEVHLEQDAIPTMGANGFLVRKTLLDMLDIGDYLFDIDVIHDLVVQGHKRFAKVKTGIVHIYGRGLSDFSRKQLRRVRDFQYYRLLEMRSYPWTSQKKTGLLKFILYCLTVAPLVLQSLKGYRKRPDPSWALHTPACLITLAIYTWGLIEGKIMPHEQRRTGWKQ